MTAPARPAGRTVAVVTGAGSGLGRELAVALAAKGWDLVLVGRRADRLAATSASLAPEAEVGTVVADVADPETARVAVAVALDRFGRLDAVVNNAAVARFAPLADATTAVGELLHTNVVGPLALIRQAAPELARRRGAVVNVGSIGGLLALPGRSAYGASKAALHHLTRSLARELAPQVRVNTVAPGAMDTEMYDQLGWDTDAVTTLRAEMVATTPLGRMGRPEDVVPWIELLLGPAGGWVTGSLFVIDGGRSC
jgi:NAD(P)-dependent dehydrogenase (short-subunit alcohol dehydrogenase family)